jgi:hypothetical protein
VGGLDVDLNEEKEWPGQNWTGLVMWLDILKNKINFEIS